MRLIITIATLLLSLQAFGQGTTLTLEIPEIPSPKLFNAPPCECRYDILHNPHLSYELSDIAFLGRLKKSDPGGYFQRNATALFEIEAMWKAAHPSFTVRYPTIDQACSPKIKKDELYIVMVNDDAEGRYVTSSCSILPYNHSEARAIIALLGRPEYEATWEEKKDDDADDGESFSFPNPLNIFKW